jgi:poly-gamma-glutamate capsule biosynthesis protein CapA/YwtB (metallophosphatase superfamily)
MRRTLLFLVFALPIPAQPSEAPFRFALVGDSIINRRISVYDEPGYLELLNRIRGADASFTNFEMLVNDFQYPGAPVSGGAYMGASPVVLDELKWAGFKLFGAANNHSFDFGTEGMLANLRHLKEAGVAFAGIGENLARARAPGYLDTKKGRVALISCASTFSLLSAAGEQRPDFLGRPGLNPLHFKITYIVDPATLSTLRGFAGSGGEGGEARQQSDLRFLGATFKAGDKPGIRTEPDPRDLKGITAEISETRRQADWVVVSIHAHEGAPGNREIPAEFLVAFAHAAVDAGADVFVGHGPHVLRGIEIYKGKPIFYSLANFVFQSESLIFQPQESYDAVNLPLTASPADYFDARSAHDTRGFPADQEVWESVEAEALFNAKRELLVIDLHPITLGFGKSRTQRGRPLPATPEEAQKIVSRVAKLSQSFGTTVSFERGKGVVTVVPSHAAGNR